MNEYQKSCSDAFYYWEIAKNKSDYSLYAPYLKNVLENQIKIGQYMKDDNKSLYETFLDMYEEDITEKELDEFFNKLKERIVPLLKKIMESNVEIKDDFLFKKVSKDNQMKMGKYISSLLGYDFSLGMVKESEHPFNSTLLILIPSNFLNPKSIYSFFFSSSVCISQIVLFSIKLSSFIFLQYFSILFVLLYLLFL